MRSRFVALACLLAIGALVTAFSACGDEAATEVVEGEPAELGELLYNVQITRFLNPDDVEDSELLADQPDPEPGQSYLGVFLTITNENKDESVESADEYTVLDVTGDEFEPTESENPYALDIGAAVPAEGQLPIPDSTAATGPNKGSLLLFLVDDTVSENRPLELEIGSDAGTGIVELDI